MTSPRRRATTAVVVVHGIGMQKRGRTLRSFSEPLAQFLAAQGSCPVQIEQRDGKNGQPGVVELRSTRKVRGHRIDGRVLILEAHWANPRHRPGPVAAIGWLIRSLPILLLLLLSPGREDFDMNPDRTRSAAAWIYRYTLPFLILFCLLQGGWVWAAGVVVVALILCSVRYVNVLGDVYMAAVNEAEVQKIAAKINRVIDHAVKQADRVLVVGHSQGGYLSHRALRARCVSPGAHTKFELVGIGSGLKPIWVLRTFGSWRSSILAWLMLAGGGLTALSLAPIPFELLQYVRPFLQEWIPQAVRSLTNYNSTPSFGLADPRLLLPDVHHPLIGVPDLPQLVSFVLGVVLIVAARLAIRFPLERLELGELSRPEVVDQWDEVTSSDDSVGRLSRPHLTGANEYGIPGVGNPMLDHISYFRKGSPTTWYLARRLFPENLRSTMDTLVRWAYYLDSRIVCARAFAATIALLTLAMFIIHRLNPNKRGLSILTSPTNQPWLLLSAILVIAIVPVALAAFDRRRLATALDTRPLISPPPFRKLRKRVREAVAMGGWWLLALFVQTSQSFPVQFSGMDLQDRLLFPIAPYVLAGMLYGVGAAVAVGYSWSAMGWQLIIVGALVLTTFLPGHTNIFFLYIALLVTFSAAVTILNQTTERTTQW